MKLPLFRTRAKFERIKTLLEGRIARGYQALYDRKVKELQAEHSEALRIARGIERKKAEDQAEEYRAEIALLRGEIADLRADHKNYRDLKAETEAVGFRMYSSMRTLWHDVSSAFQRAQIAQDELDGLDHKYARKKFRVLEK